MVESISRRGEQRDDPSLAEVLYVLRGRRLLVAGCALIFALAALLFGLLREPVYTAEATVSVSPREGLSDDDEREVFLQGVLGIVATEGLLRKVMYRAGWEAGLEEFRDRLDPRIFVTRDGGSGLRVRFSGSEPEQAARAANAYAALFVEKVERLNDERLAGGALAADASVERRAARPEGSSLRVPFHAAVAAGVGLLVGGAWALVLEGRARGWRGGRDVELTLRAPVLGVIPDYSSAERKR
jgi:capsular polysaccharide biosynthesis protein